MQDFNKLKEIIEKAKDLKAQTDKEKKEKESIIEIVDVTPILTQEEPQNTLPSTFISASTIRLSSKEATNALTFHQRLSQADERYDKIQISEDKGKKILKGMVRLTTGSASVVPMKCKGSDCSMKETCLTGDTLVLTPKGHVKITSLNIGDKVYSLTVKDKRLVLDTITNTTKAGVKEVFEIKTKYGNKITATSDHAFLIKDDAENLVWKTIEDGLFIDDYLTVEDFDPKYADDINSEGDIYFDPIISIKAKGLHDVYDITVELNSNFIANNIISHNCQPATELVLTTDGYKLISELDPTVDKIISYNEKSNIVSPTPRAFTVHTRSCSEYVYVIKGKDKAYKCSSNHICYTSFNIKALNKHVVYLMQKGNKFRVGVTTLIQDLKPAKSKTRYQFGLRMRMNMEKADKGWILGVYNSRTEALLDEEYYSIKLSSPKSLFIADDSARHTRWNGKNKWVSQEDLDIQFSRINKEVSFYEEQLKALHLDYDYPFYNRNSGMVIQPGIGMHVRACNLLPEYMDIHYKDENGNMYKEELNVEREFYTGTIYSLDVEVDHNYFTTDGILTRNCPYYAQGAAPVNLPCLVERDLISYWMEKYIIQFNVEEDSITDMHMISRLCEYDIYDMRLSRYLAEHDQTLLADFVTAYGEDGAPITNKTVSAAFEIKERIDKSRSKTLKELMATREAKQKLAVAAQVSNNIDFAGLKDMLATMHKNKEKTVN